MSELDGEGGVICRGEGDFLCLSASTDLEGKFSHHRSSLAIFNRKKKK